MIQVGPIPLHLYGLTIAIALWIAFKLVKNRAALYGLDTSDVEDLFILMAPLVLIGARLYHVLDKWGYYSQNLGEIPALWHGGLGIFGALFGGFLGVIIFAKIKNLKPINFFDLLAPPVALAQSIGRLGNFANQEAFGPPTNLPWGVSIRSENRPEMWINYSKFHPTFFYESILLLGISLILFYFERYKGRKNGQITALYCILYCTSRLTTEFYRFDTAVIGPLKTAQVLSILLIIIGFLIVRRPLWKT